MSERDRLPAGLFDLPAGNRAASPLARQAPE